MTSEERRAFERQVTEEIVDLVKTKMLNRAHRLVGLSSRPEIELTLRGIVAEASQEARAEILQRYGIEDHGGRA